MRGISWAALLSVVFVALSLIASVLGQHDHNTNEMLGGIVLGIAGLTFAMLALRDR